MIEIVLQKPTVAEIIAALSRLPQESWFTLDDADTRDTIDIIHITIYDFGEVQLSGLYGEMKSDAKD